jgi:hypothetical protein
MFQNGLDTLIGSLGLPATLTFIVWGGVGGVKLYRELKTPLPGNEIRKNGDHTAALSRTFEEKTREMGDVVIAEIRSQRETMVEQMKNSQTIMLLTIDKLLTENRALIKAMIDER